MACGCKDSNREELTEQDRTDDNMVAYAVCGVCSRLFNDFAAKSVVYCRFCKEYLCEVHKSDWKQRFRATVIKYIRR